MDILYNFFTHMIDPKFLEENSRYLLLIILIISFLEVFIPPIPGDTALILGSSIGVIAGFHPIWIILSAFLGTYSASILLYHFGFGIEHKMLDSPRLSWLLDTKTFLKIQEWFQRFGFWTLFFSRLLPIARSGIALAAGMVNYDKQQTYFALALSTFFSTTIFVMIGRFIGRRWEDIYGALNLRLSITWLMIGLFAVILVIVGIRKYLMKK